MTLDELLTFVARSGARGVSSDRQTAVRIDSRRVRAGDVFVAIRGPNCDGHDFIGQAVASGAGYIVHERDRSLPEVSGPAGKPVVIAVDHPALAAGRLAQAARGNPSAQLTNLAVTGTNGKTTITFLVRSCLEPAGRN